MLSGREGSEKLPGGGSAGVGPLYQACSASNTNC